MIFHLFAHNVPVEERSRAFGYLVAAGSVGQVVASVVSSFIACDCYTRLRKDYNFVQSTLFSFFFPPSDMSAFVMANWILFIWLNRYFMDIVVVDAVSGDKPGARDTIIRS